MTEFYKLLFKPILDKWREGERKSTKNFVQQFICKNAGFMHLNKSKQTTDIQKLTVLCKESERNDFQSF